MKKALLIFFCLLSSEAQAGEAGQGWFISPSVDAGWVYEFPQYASFYKGIGITAGHKKSWLISAGFSLEEYDMTYFGVKRDTLQSLLRREEIREPFLTRLTIAERKSDWEIMLGRCAGNACISGGIREITLDNNFSTMELKGPSLRAEMGYRNLSLRLDGILNAYGEVKNHRDDFVLFDGERTISFYGKPRYAVGLGADWNFFKRFSLGYEVMLMTFDYTYRYRHGIALKAVF